MVRREPLSSRPRSSIRANRRFPLFSARFALILTILHDVHHFLQIDSVRNVTPKHRIMSWRERWRWPFCAKSARKRSGKIWRSSRRATSIVLIATITLYVGVLVADDDLLLMRLVVSIDCGCENSESRSAGRGRRRADRFSVRPALLLHDD